MRRWLNETISYTRKSYVLVGLEDVYAACMHICIWVSKARDKVQSERGPEEKVSLKTAPATEKQRTEWNSNTYKNILVKRSS